MEQRDELFCGMIMEQVFYDPMPRNYTISITDALHERIDKHPKRKQFKTITAFIRWFLEENLPKQPNKSK